MKTIQEIIDTIKEYDSINEEIQRLKDIIINKYNYVVEGWTDEEYEKWKECPTPIFYLNREFSKLGRMIERYANINIEEYIHSNEFKNDTLYKKYIDFDCQFIAYILYLISDEYVFTHLDSYDGCVAYIE